ncbi:MAG: TetR/AcrR family transcriptional regulator [Pseudomonadales bacterium]
MSQPPPACAEAGVKPHIKRVARYLFAERGVHDVSVREIAQAAGQRNLGVVAYYFGTKEQLIREILIDGAERIEARREEHLRGLEENGGPHSVRCVVEAIVLPSARFAEQDEVYGSCFNRFLAQLSFTSADLIDRTLEGRWNRGYQRCLGHLRRLLPDLTRAEQNRRFLFLGSYISTLLAQREFMLADPDRDHPTWRSKTTLDDIVRTATALLTAPGADR